MEKIKNFLIRFNYLCDGDRIIWSKEEEILLNDAIAELEALQNRSCESCSWREINNPLGICTYLDIHTKDSFCCNRWESKC